MWNRAILDLLLQNGVNITLMIFLSFLSPVASFTIVTPSRVIPTHNVAHPIPISATTTLLSSREIHPIIGGRSPSHAKSTTTALLMNFSPPDKADTGGLERGKYILILAMFLNVWLFRWDQQSNKIQYLYGDHHTSAFSLKQKQSIFLLQHTVSRPNFDVQGCAMTKMWGCTLKRTVQPLLRGGRALRSIMPMEVEWNLTFLLKEKSNAKELLLLVTSLWIFLMMYGSEICWKVKDGCKE